MPDFLKVLLIAGGTFLVLLAIRELWMRTQVGKAVRRDLVPPPAIVLGISAANSFTDCGSVKAAFWASLCDRDFCVRYRDHGGDSRQLSIVAVFYPLVGLLRRVLPRSERWDTGEAPAGEA